MMFVLLVLAYISQIVSCILQILHIYELGIYADQYNTLSNMFGLYLPACTNNICSHMVQLVATVLFIYNYDVACLPNLHVYISWCNYSCSLSIAHTKYTVYGLYM